MDRDTYTSRMAAGIHRMRKIAERQQLDKRAFDFNEASSKAMEWLKNNWGKAGGTGLLALLGYGLGRKALGPLGGLLGLAAGGAGGWFGGDWLQKKYDEGRKNAWQQAYNDAYAANRVKVDQPELWKKINTQDSDKGRGLLHRIATITPIRRHPLVQGYSGMKRLGAGAYNRVADWRNNKATKQWAQAQGQQDALARQKAAEIATSTTGWDPDKQQGVTP